MPSASVMLFDLLEDLWHVKQWTDTFVIRHDDLTVRPGKQETKITFAVLGRTRNGAERPVDVAVPLALRMDINAKGLERLVESVNEAIAQVAHGDDAIRSLSCERKDQSVSIGFADSESTRTFYRFYLGIAPQPLNIKTFGSQEDKDVMSSDDENM